MIPELELLIGAQPPVPDLPPAEAEGRFAAVFQHFVGACATPERPLALFLDDLQWADAASLKLLEVLMKTPGLALFLVGAYRDNEVQPGHPLALSLGQDGAGPGRSAGHRPLRRRALRPLPRRAPRGGSAQGEDRAGRGRAAPSFELSTSGTHLTAASPPP